MRSTYSRTPAASPTRSSEAGRSSNMRSRWRWMARWTSSSSCRITRFGVGIQPRPERREAERDGRQDLDRVVVDVVRHAQPFVLVGHEEAGEQALALLVGPAQGLVARAKLLLRELAPRDVAIDAEHELPAGELDDRGGDLDRQHVPVPVAVVGLQGDDALASDARQVGDPFVRRALREVQRVDRAADQLLARVAVHAARGVVAVHDRPGDLGVVRVDEHHRVRRGREELMELLLRLRTGRGPRRGPSDRCRSTATDRISATRRRRSRSSSEKTRGVVEYAATAPNGPCPSRTGAVAPLTTPHSDRTERGTVRRSSARSSSEIGPTASRHVRPEPACDDRDPGGSDESVRPSRAVSQQQPASGRRELVHGGEVRAEGRRNALGRGREQRVEAGLAKREEAEIGDGLEVPGTGTPDRCRAQARRRRFRTRVRPSVDAG